MFSADLENMVENDHLNAAYEYDFSHRLLDYKTSLRSIGYIVKWYELVEDKYVYHSELLDMCGATEALRFDFWCKSDRLLPIPFRLVGIDPR